MEMTGSQGWESKDRQTGTHACMHTCVYANTHAEVYLEKTWVAVVGFRRNCDDCVRNSDVGKTEDNGGIVQPRQGV